MSRLVSDEVWATLTIWQESRGEPHNGRVAVAEVIRNRMLRRYQSDGTVVGTVLRSYQFSGWNTRDPNRLAAAVIDDDDLVVASCRHAWQEAMRGSDWAKGGLLYLNPRAVTEEPPWVAACHEVARIGNHVFYKTGPKG